MPLIVAVSVMAKAALLIASLSLCDLHLILSLNLGPEIPGVESLSPSSSEIIKTSGAGGLVLE